MGENVEFTAEEKQKKKNVQRHSAALDVSIRLTSIFPHGWEIYCTFRVRARDTNKHFRINLSLEVSRNRVAAAVNAKLPSLTPFHIQTNDHVSANNRLASEDNSLKFQIECLGKNNIVSNRFDSSE